MSPLARSCVAFFAAVLSFGATARPVLGTPIATWNFNSTASTYDFTSPNSLPADTGSGTLTTNWPSSNYEFPGSVLKLRSDDNNGKSITFSLSTLGFQDLMLTFASDKNPNGFNSNQVAYSTNGGMTFTNFGTPYDPLGTLGNVDETISFDFSSVSSLDNQANVLVQIVLSGATNNGGQNRFDNIVFSGTKLNGGGGGGGGVGETPIPEPATLAVFGLMALGGAGYIRRRKGVATA